MSAVISMDIHLGMLALTGAIGILILLSWHNNKEDAFDLRYLIVDGVTGRASLFKIGQGVALVVSTWGFIVLVSRDKLSEWYFLAYIATFAAANLTSKAIDSKAIKDENK